MHDMTSCHLKSPQATLSTAGETLHSKRATFLKGLNYSFTLRSYTPHVHKDIPMGAPVAMYRDEKRSKPNDWIIEHRTIALV